MVGGVSFHVDVEESVDLGVYGLFDAEGDDGTGDGDSGLGQI